MNDETSIGSWCGRPIETLTKDELIDALLSLHRAYKAVVADRDARLARMI